MSIFDSDVHPELVVTSRCFNLLRKMRSTALQTGTEAIWSWHNKGTLVSTVRAALRRDGWIEGAMWQWNHPESRAKLNLRTASNKQQGAEMLHEVREAWRRAHFKHFFAKSKRHELDQAGRRATRYDAERLRKMRITKWTGAELAILTGGFTSPACCQHSTQLPTRCPRCPALGTRDHVFWECAAD